MKCKQCGKATKGLKFCCEKCKWTWHNHNRTLTPNVFYDCEVCGKHVAKYLTPAAQAREEVTNRFCSRKCAGKWRRGKNHPMWTGGRQIGKGGYIYVSCPAHPNANAKGYVSEHRLKMEAHIGRKLKRSEVVHHKNGNVADNRLCNLVLCASQAEHKALDIKLRKRDKRGRLIAW
jgi:hypothetical protein